MKKQLQQLQRQLQTGNNQPILLVGPRGTGRFSTLLALIKKVNNLNDREMKLVAKGQFPDAIILESEKDHFFSQNISEKTTSNGAKKKNSSAVKKKPKNKIVKEQVDQMMEQINLKNFQLKKKILIIKSADQLNSATANNLLKLLEEPNDNLLIFLLATNTKDLLETIYSRCRPIKFPLLSREKIISLLKKEFSLSKEQAEEIARFARGRIELARQFAREPEYLQTVKDLQEKFRQALRGGLLTSLQLTENITQSEHDTIWVLNEWIWYLKEFLEENIKNNQSSLVIKKVHKILEELLKLRNVLKTTSADKKIQLENFFLQIQ